MIPKRKNLIFLMTFLAVQVFVYQAMAQLSVNGQLRTRTELRSGQGSPINKDSTAAFFTSQRTRVSLGYSTYRLKVGVTLQDVRVWGQDVSSFNRTTTANNNGLMLHEAWAELGLTDTINKKQNLALKIGRQELVYDDHRLLGNLDWTQQGRRHDAAVLKYTTGAWMLHLGLAFNQNNEKAQGTIYNETSPGNYTDNTNGGNMYKSFQYLYVGRKLKEGNVSFLAFADQFNQFHYSTTSVLTWDLGTWTRYTTGLYLNNNFGKLGVVATAYYQGGKTSTGLDVSAALLSLATQYNFSKKFGVGPGFDYTTGGSNTTKSSTFDPLYGTPHKFWGLMDYFYVANGFGGKGLQDYYLKSKWKPTSTFQLAFDLHQFYSASNVYASGSKLTRDFGTELDMVGTYTMTKTIGFELGYSHFASTSTLISPTVKNIPNGQNNSNWAYLMITIKPDFLSK